MKHDSKEMIILSNQLRGEGWWWQQQQQQAGQVVDGEAVEHRQQQEVGRLDGWPPKLAQQQWRES